jgi:hypothetical protein
MVGATGFEPATSCSQGKRANHAALRPDESLRYHKKALPINGATATKGMESGRNTEKPGFVLFPFSLPSMSLTAFYPQHSFEPLSLFC